MAGFQTSALPSPWRGRLFPGPSHLTAEESSNLPKERSSDDGREMPCLSGPKWKTHQRWLSSFLSTDHQDRSFDLRFHIFLVGHGKDRMMFPEGDQRFIEIEKGGRLFILLRFPAQFRIEERFFIGRDPALLTRHRRKSRKTLSGAPP